MEQSRADSVEDRDFEIADNTGDKGWLFKKRLVLKLVKCDSYGFDKVGEQRTNVNLIRYEFANCGSINNCPNTAESNYESVISCPIKTEPTATEHDPLDINVVLIKEDPESNLQIHKEYKPLKNGVADNINTIIKTDLQEEGGSDSIKTAVSPKREELVRSDEIDIEYNIDIDKEFKMQKREMCYAPNRRNTEVEERILGPSQDLQIAVYSDTYVRTPDQSKDSPKECLIGRDSDSDAREKLFSCNICKKFFIHKQYLLKHTRRHTGKRPFSCNICTKSFTQKGYLVDHIRIHTGEKPFSCNICIKSFTKKGDLLRHKRTHTRERPFSCNICTKSFIRKEHLVNHIRIHTGEKPFSCNICTKSFTRKKSLVNHIRIHTGEKPLSCNTCKNSFTQTGDLLRHMRTHTRERPFSCNICTKPFTQKGHLVNHIRIHTGEKPFSCNICMKSFTQKGALLKHMRTHTGETFLL